MSSGFIASGNPAPADGAGVVVVAGSDTVVEMGSVVPVTVGPVVDAGDRVVDAPSPSPSPHPAANRNSVRITVARALIVGTPNAEATSGKDRSLCSAERFSMPSPNLLRAFALCWCRRGRGIW